MAGTTPRRRLLWLGGGLLLVVVLRFVVRWADATGRLPRSGEPGIAAVLPAVALLVGVALLVRRAQTRKNR